jgi:hypothetical protein
MSDSLRAALDLACDMSSGLLYIQLDKLRDEPSQLPLLTRVQDAHRLLIAETSRLLSQGIVSDQLESAIRACSRAIARSRTRRVSETRRGKKPVSQKEAPVLVFQHIDGETVTFGILPIITPTATRHSRVVTQCKTEEEALILVAQLEEVQALAREREAACDAE